MLNHSPKGWLMLLSDTEDSAWGAIEEFYADIEAENSDPIEFESEVWGKLHRKDLSPRSGDGIAFYHTSRARFPHADPYKRRPRISLLGELLDIRFHGQVVNWLKVRIRRKDLENLRRTPLVRDAGTEYLFQKCGMVRGSVATFYEILPEVWAELRQRVSDKSFLLSESERPESTTHQLNDREFEAVGVGFGDPQKNQQVERAAINFVKDFFQREGWEVESVEGAKCGYDLQCKKGHQEKHVEVKGVSGTRVAFIITEQEMSQAKKNPQFHLCVVTEALSQKPRLYQWEGEHVIDAFSFRPLQYAAALRE